MTRPIFWVCWDYGQGGLWALVRASSAEQVRARCPQLEVFETAPTILNEEAKAIIGRSGIHDLDAAPSGWLKDLVPPPAQSISSAAQFEDLLELVQRQLRNGALKQSSTDHSGLPRAEVLHLPLGGPWPDVIEADFVDAHGHSYHLSVDCYHGTGVWHDPTIVATMGLRGASGLGSRFEGLPDWQFEVSEVSAGVHRATGTDRSGHRVVTEGVDPDACLEECRSAALMLVGDR